MPLPQGGNFPGSERIHIRRRFLKRMNPEGPQKMGGMSEPRPGILKSQQQVPVNGELQRFIELRAYRFPQRTAPEKGFLRYVIEPAQHVRVVFWQDPAAHFKAA